MKPPLSSYTNTFVGCFVFPAHNSTIQCGAVQFNCTLAPPLFIYLVLIRSIILFVGSIGGSILCLCLVLVHVWRILCLSLVVVWCVLILCFATKSLVVVSVTPSSFFARSLLFATTATIPTTVVWQNGCFSTKGWTRWWWLGGCPIRNIDIKGRWICGSIRRIPCGSTRRWSRRIQKGKLRRRRRRRRRCRRCSCWILSWSTCGW